MNERAGPSDLERVIFFSDAVFAIAITLLVVELGVPDVPRAELGSALTDLWPKVLAFFLSFAVIGRYWLAHRSAFRELYKVDGTLLALNLVFLALIAFQPFPTAVLGSYASATSAVVLYAGCLSLTGFALTGLWAYAWRAKLIVTDDVRARRFLAGSFGPPLVFAASIPLALLSASLAKWSWLAILVVGRLVPSGVGDEEGE